MISICKCCLTEFKYSPSNSTGTYCSNKCQRDFQRKEYITKWLSGEVNGTHSGSAKHLSSHIKTYLHENFKECSVCHISEWNNLPIVLEIDHIDGDGLNNVPDNLRVICPNCHSQTDTFKGRNKGNGKRNYWLKS